VRSEALLQRKSASTVIYRTVALLRDKMKGTVHPLLCDSTLECTRDRHAEETTEPRFGQKAYLHLQLCDTMQV